MSKWFSDRFVRFAVLLVVAWCVMTVTHELGHVVCGVCCGGTLIALDLAPWRMPYSLFDPDPHPLMTVWAGPLLGVVVPYGMSWLARRDFVWFIAHFCALANGSYIAVAWFTRDRYLDTTKMIEHGSSAISIGLYCAATIGIGYVGFRASCVKLLTRDAD